MGVLFGVWPSNLHSDFEQVKRIDAGRKLKKKVISFDPDMQTMVISGSAAEPYQCDLEACTCADFAIRNLPCKHIYCRRMNLVFSPIYRNTKKAADHLILLPRWSAIAPCMNPARSALMHT